MKLQDELRSLFERYCAEFGEGYDRSSFLDFVVATLSEPGDVQTLIKAYTQRLFELGKMFPERAAPVQLTAYMIEGAIKKLMQCEHPHVSTEGGDSDLMWCNVCGAIQTVDGGWVSPHCRDLLIQLVGP